MRAAVLEGHATATDLADYLARKGVPFRDAHEIVGRAVRSAEKAGVDLAGLSLAQLKSFSKHIQADVKKILTPEGSVAARDHIGGTAPAQVRQAIRRARKRLAK
jgi:argininosuccinate lyase